MIMGKTKNLYALILYPFKLFWQIAFFYNEAQ